MTWMTTAAQLTAVLTAIMAAAWFVIRQNAKIAAGVLAIKENDLKYLHEKLDELHGDIHKMTDKLDRHLEWHLGTGDHSN